MTDARSHRGWTPVWVHSTRRPPEVEWCRFGERRFVEPFFSESAERVASIPFNALFRHSTDLSELLDLEASCPGLSPTGFIFHVSRCGSTLISQMLASLPDNIVISEAPPVEGVLRLNRFQPGLAAEDHARLFRALISALGQPRSGERHLIVKFEPWHTLDIPFIRRAFPDVPFLFVYRDPLEILVSQARVPAGRMLVNPIDATLAGLDLITAATLPRQEYWAILLATWFEALIAGAGARTRLLEYRQLPYAVFQVVKDFFGISPSSLDVEAMRAAARFDAKARTSVFVPDSQQKQTEATPELVRAASAVRPLFERLETMRTTLVEPTDSGTVRDGRP